MNYCSKCGAETTLRNGVSKKNGKAWKAYVCTMCKNFDFISDAPKPTYNSFTPTIDDFGTLRVQLNTVIGLLREILKVLQEANKFKPELPDDDVGLPDISTEEEI